MLDYKKIFNRTKRAFAKAPAPATVAESAPDDVTIDPKAILASTEKLLAINRGEAEPDERDSLEYRRVHTPDKLFAERIKMDANKIRRVAMRRVAKSHNLKPIGVAHFDPYTEGLIVSNPLSSPLEEIGPASLIEQARRITQMGPGGIQSSESISDESSAVHPSIFGFLSPIEGPESERSGVDTRLAWGAKVGSDGKIYNKFLNRKTGKHQYMSASDLSDKVVGIPE